jgi:hypothetical protein
MCCRAGFIPARLFMRKKLVRQHAGANALSNAIGYAKHCSRSHDAVIAFIMSIRANQSLTMISSQHVYEIRPRKDRRGLELISDRLPLGLLRFEGPDAVVDAINYAKLYSPSHTIIIRLFDECGAVIATHEVDTRNRSVSSANLFENFARPISLMVAT